MCELAQLAIGSLRLAEISIQKFTQSKKLWNIDIAKGIPGNHPGPHLFDDRDESFRLSLVKSVTRNSANTSSPADSEKWAGSDSRGEE